MTQEEKDLLLKDLCGRLPYGVKCNVGDNKPYTLSRLEVDSLNGHLLDFIEMKDGLDVQVYLSEVKPYLFPLSSMTAEQLYALREMFGFKIEFDNGFIDFCGRLSYLEMNTLFEWFNKYHFDYRELISNGLGIDCTNLNIY